MSENDLTAEADAFVTHQHVSNLGNAQVVIASQSGTCFADGFAGNAGTCRAPGGNYCAWHTNSGLGETFTNLPLPARRRVGMRRELHQSGQRRDL